MQKSLLRHVDSQLRNIEVAVHKNSLQLQHVQESLGRIEARQLNLLESSSINDYEYRVYSQWGEDGIIQYLIRSIDIKSKIFVEFGVEDYSEANSRFLLINNNWSGLVIDGNEENILKIRSDRLYWLYNLKACCEFITCDNINDIFLKNGISGEIGLLSIDIDGNDYWVWESIKSVNPVIVVIEYNYRFGPIDSIVVPYNADFVRSKIHHSMTYFGASLRAICDLAEKKGYIFVGCCSNGVNAFFVRSDKKPDKLKSLTAEEGFFPGTFCELRDAEGNMKKVSPQDEVNILKEIKLPKVNPKDLVLHPTEHE